jgi:hypothetical protein
MLADEPNLPGEILKLLHELGVSLTYHSAWLKRLHRTLVCGAAPSSDDLAADAHCKCMFGKWYYGEVDTRLKDLPLYGETRVSRPSVSARGHPSPLAPSGCTTTDSFCTGSSCG